MTDDDLLALGSIDMDLLVLSILIFFSCWMIFFMVDGEKTKCRKRTKPFATASLVPPSGASFLRPDVLPSLAYIDRVSSGGHAGQLAGQLGWAAGLGARKSFFR